MSVLVVILVLSLLVVIHELGHLMAALWAKIKVEEFGVGYPPKVIRLFCWRGIPFTLNAIPFGGFVRMAGEDTKPGSSPVKGDYNSAPIGKRTVVILAGVTMNFLFGVLILSSIYTFTGIPTTLSVARIGVVQPESPAASAGLKEGVNILSVVAEDQTIDNPTVQQVQEIVRTNQAKSLTFVTTGPCEGTTCVDQPSSISLVVRTTDETPEGQGLVGIVFQDQVLVHYPFWQMPFRGAVYGVKQAVYLGLEIIQALGSLISQIGQGSVPADVVGPIGIAGQAEEIKLAEKGIIVITIFTAMISINLAIMNILPIPPLDGGRLLFTLLEPFVKKERLRTIEYWANYTGFIVLIGLILAISARDIWGLVVKPTL